MNKAVSASSLAGAAPTVPQRVIIIDDSVVARVMLAQIFDPEPDFTVCASFDRAGRALDWLRENRCDIVLLDIEMPGRSGLAALPDLIAASGDARIVVVSSTAAEGASATLQALALGAVDALEKPASGPIGRQFGLSLVERIRGIAAEPFAPAERTPIVAIREVAPSPVACIAIGASTGGIHAIARLLAGLPRRFDTPILMTQHLPPPFIPFFAEQLTLQTRRPCRVARTGDIVTAGTMLIAPGEGHLTVHRDGDAVRVAITSAPVQARCMPSVDPMFTSVAAAYGSAGVGIVLSGMGRDGAEGAQHIADRGGTLLVQDAESSTIWGMPGAVARKGLASLVASPERIASHLVWRRGAA